MVQRPGGEIVLLREEGGQEGLTADVRPPAQHLQLHRSDLPAYMLVVFCFYTIFYFNLTLVFTTVVFCIMCLKFSKNTRQSFFLTG